MGAAYSNLFDAQNALSYYTQSIELAERQATASSPLRHSIILEFSIGPCRIMTRRSTATSAPCGTGARSATALRNPRTLENMGLLCLEKGDTDKSLEFFQHGARR